METVTRNAIRMDASLLKQLSRMYKANISLKDILKALRMDQRSLRETPLELCVCNNLRL